MDAKICASNYLLDGGTAFLGKFRGFIQLLYWMQNVFSSNYLLDARFLQSAIIQLFYWMHQVRHPIILLDVPSAIIQLFNWMHQVRSSN